MRRDREASAAALPPGKTDHLIPDGGVPGLALRLRASGSRTWIFSYRLGTKQRRIALGSATVLGVQEARRRATQLYANVKLGNDPALKKAETKARVAETVGALLPSFLARQKDRLRPRALIEVERHLLIHAKRLHHLPVADLTRRDVATLLSALAEKLSGATANRVRTSLSGFFTWCIREGILDASPVVHTERREEVARTRLLDDDELRDIWATLRADAYGDVMRLLILTGARAREIGGLRWSEVDLTSRWIKLPPTRVKNRREHEIYLSDSALEILQRRPRLTWPDGSPCDLVFGRGKEGFNDWAGSKIDLDARIDRARKAAGTKPIPKWVPHDFRRLISTAMHERLAIPPHIVESVLGHVGHQGGTPGRYNLSVYRAEKADALTRWAALVAEIVKGSKHKIVPLRA